MEDPIEKMRKALEQARALTELNQFAQKCEENSFEADWKEFVAKIRRAFSKVKREFFREKFEELPDVQTDPGFILGFYAQDSFGAFWFWIGIAGRIPEAHARRRSGKAPALKVATHLLGSKPNSELTEITEDDIVRAVADAYTKSFQKL